MIRRPPRSTQSRSSAASDVYKRQVSTQSTWGKRFQQKIGLQMAAFSLNNIPAIEAHLANHQFLSGGAFPNATDVSIFFELKQAPEKSSSPNFHFWYLFLSQFTPPVIKSWSGAAQQQAQPAQAQAAPAPAAAKKDDVDDLFGDDDDEAAAEAAKALAEKKKKEAEAKKKEKVVIAKSVIIFDVKVYEEDQDLDALAAKILALEIDGLLWKTEYKKIPVAYNIKKLQIGCTIEDDKVSTDDLFEKITAWEDEVQSVDIVTFQKV
eukprot:TRINITY_DN19448_c0_g1_i1.p1 TRINITY_DN19448_c0_g1~~TRINITY_DN19448_c0_g1_i1.p1  ORF type:complete len:264 (+),score=110.71 TRINITY_DN19448_c0_g1_i1:53-844(+)